MNPEDKIGLEPAVSVSLVDHPIDLPGLQRLVDDPDVGAHGWFLGVTRRHTSADNETILETAELTYEAHRKMAVSELRRIADTAITRFGLRRVTIVHRLGCVAIGEASVAVGCSSAHRIATFNALPWMLDQLKRDVPIWKRERYADGSTSWIHPQ